MTRILLCTSGGLYGSLVLKFMLENRDVEVVGIVKSTRVLHPASGWLRGAIAHLRSSGLLYTLYLGCATTLPDLLGRWCGLPSVSVSARQRGIPLCTSRDINGAAECEFIADQRPDLLVSAFFNQRIGPSVCDIAAAGAVNIHPSLLPEFKGVDPVFFARLRGASHLGVTVHRVTADFDSGPVLVQAEVPTEPAASVIAATAKLFVHGAGRLLDCLPTILRGEPERAQASGGSYDSWPTPTQVQAFLGRGHRLMRFVDASLLRRDALSRLTVGESSKKSLPQADS